MSRPLQHESLRVNPGSEEVVHFGRFELVRRISSGGMGEVYLAKVRGPYAFEKYFILKLMKEHLNQDPVHLKLFAREARVGADLNHPNIVQIFDFGSVRGRYFITMEYVEGTSLSRVTKAMQMESQVGRKMFYATAAYLVALIARALGYMHERQSGGPENLQKLVHRDVSPENILISKTGEVKLTDLGLVKYSGAEDLTANGKVRGKLAYMAPERVLGKAASAAADQFSLGIVLHELLVGKRYFEPEMQKTDLLDQLVNREIESPKKYCADIPSELNAVVRRATSLEPAERYESMAQMEEALLQFVEKAGAKDQVRRHLAELVRLTTQVDLDGVQRTAMQKITLPAAASPEEKINEAQQSVKKAAEKIRLNAKSPLDTTLGSWFMSNIARVFSLVK